MRMYLGRQSPGWRLPPTPGLTWTGLVLLILMCGLAGFLGGLTVATWLRP